MLVSTKRFIKCYSMQETPQLGNEYLWLSFLLKDSSSVKMSLTWGQSAWVNINPSETKRSTFSTRIIAADKENFKQWLVGVSDGDGCFSFYYSNKKKKIWTFDFNISQKATNIKMLYHIKSKLGVGRVYCDKSTRMAKFRIRDKRAILEKIIPIFDTYSLLTVKRYRYDLFKKALFISLNSKLSADEKDVKISKLQALMPKKIIEYPKNYRSPVWKNAEFSFASTNKKEAEKLITKPWLIGFTEAEGSFYIVEKDFGRRLSHAFEITQALDDLLLYAISLVLEIKTEVSKKKTHFTIVTTNQKSIEFISKYYFKTFKGIKSQEFRLWERSFKKKGRGYDYLFKMREKMRVIRNKFSESNIK